MTAIDLSTYALHLIVAALWVGGVAFVTVVVLPIARAGEMSPDPLETITDRLATLSRASAVLLLLTGVYLWLAAGYEGAPASSRDFLAVAMVVLWLVLTGLTEVGVARLRDGLDRDKVRTPAADARPFLLAATLVGIVLLAIGGFLAGSGAIGSLPV